MKHIVFNEPDVKVLEAAIALDESLQGEIVLIRDDYAVGPLYESGDAEGWQKRRDWWRRLLETNADYDPEKMLDMMQDKATLHKLVQELEADEKEYIWIWAAQNKHDVSGYYWLVSQMADWQGRVFILYLNNLPFINEKGNIFYPQWLSQIPAREFLKAKKLSRPVTPSEFEIDADEWKKLVASQKMVRLLEGGKKLASQDVDYYDSGIDNYVHGGFSKASRILQLFMQKEKETTGDVFALWRLKKLATDKGYEVKGDINKTSREFELKDPSRPSLRKKDEEQATAAEPLSPENK